MANDDPFVFTGVAVVDNPIVVVDSVVVIVVTMLLCKCFQISPFLSYKFMILDERDETTKKNMNYKKK